MSLLEAINLTKVYGGTKTAVATRALNGFSLTVEAGEFVGIMGASGSGKSTLLQLLGTIDRPSSGRVLIGGQDLAKLSGEQLAIFRRRQLGFLFQDFNLLDALTLKENIIVPLVLNGDPVREIEQRAQELAVRLGIEKVLHHRPYEVSGGQKQRTAAARALIHRPALILADEPTGALDSKSATSLMASLSELNQQEQATILMVTHDPVTASYCNRIIFIKDGQSFTELRRGSDPRRFFHEILDVLSTMGGEPYDAAYARR